MTREENWDIEIKPRTGLFDINLKEIWRYRDLMMLFVKRDLVTIYQQTILGPVWFFIQPILTSITYLVVFGKIANISTGGIPKILFYLSGITIWNYFTTCLNGASSTFSTNAGVFGKVYFPRLVTPLSFVISNTLKFFIQLLPLIGFYLYFVFVKDESVRPNLYVLLLPGLLLIAGILGMSIGLIVSSLTTKYRDLSFVIAVMVQLMMYVSPVIYPLERLKKTPWLLDLVKLNPMTWIIDCFRYGFFSEGSINIWGVGYSLVVTIVLFVLGFVVFNKVEKTFIDTV